MLNRLVVESYGMDRSSPVGDEEVRRVTLRRPGLTEEERQIRGTNALGETVTGDRVTVMGLPYGAFRAITDTQGKEGPHDPTAVLADPANTAAAWLHTGEYGRGIERAIVPLNGLQLESPTGN